MAELLIAFSAIVAIILAVVMVVLAITASNYGGE